MGTVSRVALGALAVGLAAGAAGAQSFNVDFSNGGTTAPPPSNAYGAAAGQSGFWNNIADPNAAGFPLLNTAGAATPVTLTFTPGGFMFDGANSNPNGIITPTGSDDELFMDDVWDSPIAASITVSNLVAAPYRVYVYGGSPDSNTTFMQFTIGADSQLVGGQWSNPFTYQQGVTHALFNVNHTGGDLVIGVPDVVGFESVNGLQLTVIPEPASLVLMSAGALALVRRRRRR
jgi:hypothetical protein